MKKQLKQILIATTTFSVVLLATAGVYAMVPDSGVKSYVDNFRTAGNDSEIGKMISDFFDGQGYIKTEFIKDESITGNKIADNTINGTKIVNNTINGTKILDGSINDNKIDKTKVQKRIHQACPSDKAIQSISVDGTVTCVGSGSLSGGGSTPTGGGKFVDGTNTNDAVYTTGNVGIGTTSPGARLHIKNGGQNLRLLTGTNISGYNFDIGVNDDGINLYNNSSSRGFNFKNANGNLVNIKSNGNVGIGTTSPNLKLDVNGNIRARNDVYLYDDLRFTRDKAWFIVNGTTRMFIQNNGNVGIGTTSPYAKLHVYGGSDTTVSDKTSGFVTIGDVDSRNISIDNNEIMARNNGHTSNLRIQDDGGKTYFGDDVYAYAFVYRSDKRLKKDIKTLDNSLEKINKLRGVRFKWKKDNSREIGLIAQEVEKVYPDLVTTDEKDGLKSVKYGNIVAILIEGVKELYNKVVGNSEEIEKLKVENVELKNRLNSLEKRMEILEEKIIK